MNIRDRFRAFRHREKNLLQLQQLQAELLAESTPDSSYLILIVSSCAIATFGQRLDLLSSTTNWLANPPEVRLNVRAREPITPKQVALLEEFLQHEMEQSFTLIFVVGQVEEIRREEPDVQPDEVKNEFYSSVDSAYLEAKLKVLSCFAFPSSAAQHLDFD